MRPIQVGQGIALVKARGQTAAPMRAVSRPHALVGKRHVDHVLVVAAAATTKVVHLFPLKFVLDALPVGGIADEGKDWTDALNEEGTLRRLRVI